MWRPLWDGRPSRRGKERDKLKPGAKKAVGKGTGIVRVRAYNKLTGETYIFLIILSYNPLRY